MKIIFRIVGIGAFHLFLYGYVVPFIIYPRFGSNGMVFAGIAALIVSAAIFATIFIEKKTKGDNRE